MDLNLAFFHCKNNRSIPVKTNILMNDLRLGYYSEEIQKCTEERKGEVGEGGCHRMKREREEEDIAKLASCDRSLAPVSEGPPP